MNRRVLFAALICLPQAACLHFSPQPLDPRRSALELSERRLGGKTWTLSALIEQAASSQAEIAVARAQYETARAAIRTAGERPNPTISLAPQIVTPYTSLITGTYGVDFDWTIETAGKRGRRLAVAQQTARAAAARVVDASWKSRVAVRKALLELYSGEERLRLLSEASARQDELLIVLESRVTAGEEARSVTAQPRLLQAQLRLQASDANKAILLARAALAEALGMSTNGILGRQFSFAPFEKVPGQRSSHRFAALTHRADVLAALADYAAAEASLRLELAKQYPDLHLSPGYQLDQGVNKWGLGIGLTLPILNQNRGAIGEAEARRKEMAARFYAVQSKVLADCDRAAAALQAARAKLAVTDSLLATQQLQIASEQRLVSAGEGDKVALLSAQVERATTLTARLDAVVEVHTALGALEEATQTPLAP